MKTKRQGFLASMGMAAGTCLVFCAPAFGGDVWYPYGAPATSPGIVSYGTATTTVRTDPCGFGWVTNAVCNTVDSAGSNQTGPRTICYGCPQGIPTYWSFPGDGGSGPACEILTWQPMGGWSGSTIQTAGGTIESTTSSCTGCHSTTSNGNLQLLSSSAYTPVNFSCGSFARTSGPITAF